MNPARRTTTAAATAVVLATAGGLLTAVAVPASAATTCASPVYKRQFFANTTFSGTAKKTDCDSAIDQNWGTGAPASGLPSNNFGVRWTVTRDFGSGGPFSLAASAQDGIRVYLDPGTTNARKINLWKNVSSTVKKTVNITVPKGKHTLRVDYVNWTGKANVKFTYTPRTSATVDKVKPLTPTGASVTYASATGKAKLTWAKNKEKEMDLAGYRVYRRLKGAAFGSTPLATTTSTSYTDNPPATGETYYYEVRAYDKAGNESAGSADQGVTTVDTAAPAAPLDPLVSYDTTTNVAKLTWTKNQETDLAGYRLYRRLQGSTSWAEVGTTTSTTLTDTPPATGEVYYYEVRAHDKAGNESAGTADVLVTSIVLETPAWFAANATDTGAELNWSGVGAAVKYRVERTDFYGTVTKSWDLAYTVSLTDDSLERGEIAKYRVAAVDGSGHVSPYTELQMVTRPIATPRDLTASAGIGSVTLQWTMKPEDAPYTDFHVYRSTTLPVGSSGVICPTTYTELADGSRRYTCTDDDAKEGTTYHYAVEALYYTTPSFRTDPVTVTTLTSDTAPAPVTGLTATATEYGIELDWADSTEEDMYRYVVYRGTLVGDSGGEQECSASEVAQQSFGLSFYRDVALPDGESVCYFVDALDQAGNSSYMSTGTANRAVVDELDLTPSVATPEGSPLTVTASEWNLEDARTHLWWEPLDSATGYDIHRWNPVSEQYELLTTTSDNWYFDTTAAKGTTHFYWVTAHYADGTQSLPGADHVILQP